MLYTSLGILQSFAWEDRGCWFKPGYMQIHSGSDDDLEWRSSVIGSHPQWQAEEPQGRG